jgi:hypothetical protein
MVADADLITLSALQHYLYCPRQCALIGGSARNCRLQATEG